MSALLRPVPGRPADVARLTVDPAAIAANTRLLASRTDAEVMAVVKADGFGHGAEIVARTALANGASSRAGCCPAVNAAPPAGPPAPSAAPNRGTGSRADRHGCASWEGLNRHRHPRETPFNSRMAGQAGSQ